MFWILWVIIAAIAVIVLWIIGLFNGLIRLKNEVANSWAQIDVQLKRRFDLIPNLVETVKGYAKHERELFTNITKARAAVMSAKSIPAKAQASNMLSDTLKSLFAVAENYPDLKANQNFLQLQEELTGTENKISYARQHYNDIVMMFNNRLMVFPSNVFAGMLGFTQKEMFEVPAGQKEPVKVKF
jgi:LemA protein